MGIFFFYFSEGGLFIFMIFSFSSSCQKKLKNKKYSSFTSLRWVGLYFHRNILLLPVKTEEMIKKYASSISLRGGSLFSSNFSSSFCRKIIKNTKIFFFSFLSIKKIKQNKYTSTTSLRGGFFIFIDIL